MKALEVQNIYFKYNKELVLENISFDVNDKEFVTIIGPNGGGKTTLLKIILGLLNPLQGEVLIYNKHPKRQGDIIGYVPQHTNFSLDLPITIFDIVIQGRLKPKKLFFNKDDKQETLRVLETLGLADLKDRKINELSGGQRQKVLIARALVNNPKIVIMDEPTSAIDIQGQKDILELIEKIDTTKVVVSHDIKILTKKVDKVIYIHKKAVIHDGPKLDIPNKSHFCEIELIEYLKG